MATIIINPASNNNSGDNGMGFFLGVIVLIVFAILLFVYALPYLRGLGGSNGVQINVPKDIDVNVKQTE